MPDLFLKNIRPILVGTAILAAALGLLALALYVRTLAPGLLDGDAGEFQFAAWGFGLAHPTGYPLYLILGGAWQHGLALFGADPAWALNLFSAVTAAVTVALLFVTMRKIIPGPAGVSRGVALFSAALLAVNPTFWSQALIAEVYALHGLLMVLILLAALTVGWVDAAHGAVGRAGGAGVGPSSDDGFCDPWGGVGGLADSRRGGSTRRVTDPARAGEDGPVAAVDGGGAGGEFAPVALFVHSFAGHAGGVAVVFSPFGRGGDSPVREQLAGISRLFDGECFRRQLFWAEPGVGPVCPKPGRLWLDHFTWVGLGLIGVGLIALVRDRRWVLLALTLPLAVMLQVFNLFYGIGDIYVYYIPLYLIGAIYAGLGVEGVVACGGFRFWQGDMKGRRIAWPPASCNTQASYSS